MLDHEFAEIDQDEMEKAMQEAYLKETGIPLPEETANIFSNAVFDYLIEIGAMEPDEEEEEE